MSESGKKRSGKGRSRKPARSLVEEHELSFLRDDYPQVSGVDTTRVEHENGTLWERFFDWLATRRRAIHRRGRERLTVMLIPHTEKRIFNLHVNMYGIAGFLFTVVVVLIVSVINLIGKSGEDIELYDMGLTNSQFNVQSSRMAEAVVPLHEMVQRYTNTIEELYIKMDGDPDRLSGQGGLAQEVIDRELIELQELVVECRVAGEACSQSLTEEILRRVIFLSRQDNESLRRSIELADQIITDLKSREKQQLLLHTPGIWPTRGYLLSPYGWQIDHERGIKLFRQGIEIGATQGSEVYATAPGIVSDIHFDSTYGVSLWVNHRYGIRTFYAHLDRVRVSNGDQVDRGQVVGFVGKSGMTATPRLYYEVHVGTIPYNPHAFLNHLQDQWLIQPTL